MTTHRKPYLEPGDRYAVGHVESREFIDVARANSNPHALPGTSQHIDTVRRRIAEGNERERMQMQANGTQDHNEDNEASADTGADELAELARLDAEARKSAEKASADYLNALKYEEERLEAALEAVRLALAERSQSDAVSVRAPKPRAARKSSKPAATAATDDPNATAILDVLDREGVSMADLMSGTKLSRPKISAALKALIASGKAKKIGEARATKYAAV